MHYHRLLISSRMPNCRLVQQLMKAMAVYSLLPFVTATCRTCQVFIYPERFWTGHWCSSYAQMILHDKVIRLFSMGKIAYDFMLLKQWHLLL
jgi:hypothetical protein